MKIGVYFKDELSESELSTLLITKINEYGFEFDNENPDILIYVGGDGTLLRAINQQIDKLDNLLFVGINQGALGFYYDYNIDEIDELFLSLKEESFNVNNYSLIEADMEGKAIYALNEIRFENPFHTLIADVLVDNEFLETFRGNGLSIASSLGSTAYNKSLGGAVILPDIETLQLTEIAPINNRVYRSLNSPLVISNSHSIKLVGNFNEAVIGFDHLTRKEEVKEVIVKLSDKKVSIIQKRNYSDIAKVKKAFAL